MATFRRHIFITGHHFIFCSCRVAEGPLFNRWSTHWKLCFGQCCCSCSLFTCLLYCSPKQQLGWIWLSACCSKPMGLSKLPYHIVYTMITWIFRCFWFYSGFVQMNHETGPNVKTRNFIDRIIFAKINKITYMVALWLLLYWLSTWNWASARFWLGQSCHSFGIDKRILLYVHFAFAPFWLLHCSFGCLCQCNVKLFHSCHLQDLVKSFSFGWVGQILL